MARILGKGLRDSIGRRSQTSGPGSHGGTDAQGRESCLKTALGQPAFASRITDHRSVPPGFFRAPKKNGNGFVLLRGGFTTVLKSPDSADRCATPGVLREGFWPQPPEGCGGRMTWRTAASEIAQPAGLNTVQFSMQVSWITLPARTSRMRTRFSSTKSPAATGA